MVPSGKKWIVGLDLGPRSAGALRFATWIARPSQAGGERLIGIHVLEEAHLHVALRYHHLAELEARALDTARASIAQHGAADVMDAHVVEGKTADQTLEAACMFHHGYALVIGRNAPRDSANPVRLGRVARRILRSLDEPVIVVPPDLPDAGSGAVVLALSGADDAAGAAEFARDFATRFGRELVLAHVAPLPEHHSAQYLPPETLAKIRGENQANGERELAGWAEQLGLAAVRRVVLQGGVTDQLVAFAASERALALVTGSRRLSVFERWLLASTGSDVAANAGCPVAVVPATRA
ncbi:MAG TPA: universal stress protein [Nannocystaceae bacterium]|nr:universal stress protein [Nannocystaceae bacterium]